MRKGNTPAPERNALFQPPATGKSGAYACVRTIPAAERYRQNTDDLQGRVFRRAYVVVDVLDRLIEIACQRKLTTREADTADEVLHSLKQSIDELDSRRASR